MNSGKRRREWMLKPKIKLSELCTIEKGKIGITKAIPGEYPLVVTAEERLSHNEYHFEGNAVVIPLVSSSGHGHRSLKRIHFQTGRFAVGSILCVVMPKDEQVLRADYLYRFLDLNKEHELVGRMRGMANVSLPMSEIGEIEIPLPPLDEQKEFVERYAILEKETEKVQNELTHQLTLIKQLRQAFLREAMQGKLVPQNPVDGHAKDLLAQIKAEKAKLGKKEKPLPPIKPEEIPFEIPQGWVWCRLGEVVLHTEAGKSLKAEEIPAEREEWGVIKTNAITSGQFDENLNKRFSNSKNEYKSILIKKGDFIFCRASGSKGLAGVSCIVDEILASKLILSDKTIRFHLSPKINQEFIHLYNSSQFAKDYYNSLGTGKSTSMNNITREQFLNMPIPLPPKVQQDNLLIKFKEVGLLNKKIEDSILRGQIETDKLLQQVLRERLIR
jgi:type I restriction enzyme S subunit